MTTPKKATSALVHGRSSKGTSTVRSPYRLFTDALAERLRTGTESPENWAATRQAIAAQLRLCIASPATTIPAEMLIMLLTACEQAESKELPALFTPVAKRRGESPDRAGVLACKAVAVDYILFCQDHREQPGVDGASVTSVAAAFQASERQVKRWKASMVDRPAPAAPWGMSLAQHFEHLLAGMRAAGVLYRRFGGASDGAVRARAKGDSE